MRYYLDLYKGKTNEKSRGDMVEGSLDDARRRAIQMLKKDSDKKSWVKITQWSRDYKKKPHYKGDVFRTMTEKGMKFVWMVNNTLSTYILKEDGKKSSGIWRRY